MSLMQVLESVESDEHSRHPLSSRNEVTAKVHDLVGAD